MRSALLLGMHEAGGLAEALAGESLYTNGCLHSEQNRCSPELYSYFLFKVTQLCNEWIRKKKKTFCMYNSVSYDSSIIYLIYVRVVLVFSL